MLTIPINITSHKCEIFRLNFDGYCDKLASKLNLWKSKGLTVLGKIAILKTLVLPKLTCKLSLLPTDLYPPFLKSLNQLIYGFIWNCKWERISRINLARNIDSGGAKMLHMPSFILSLQWKHFCNYLIDRPSLWKDIEQSFISDATLECVQR